MKNMISQKKRKAVQNNVHAILKETYFDSIPLDEINKALQKNGMIMLQEDNTEWAGLLVGYEGECWIELAPVNTIKNEEYGKTYQPYKNTGLRLSWYKSDARKSRKIEVIGYIT